MKKTLEDQLAVLTARAVDVHSCDELRRKIELAETEKRPLRIKYGADPSAPDIHLGHVVQLNKLREFQDFGHTVVFIIGDFTGMIGDPSGRTQTRPALSRAEVTQNAKSYQEQVFRILDPARTEIRFNSEWFEKMDFSDVVKLSTHVTVAQLLARDDFSKRYSSNQPISLVEFIYPLVQGYDSVKIEADIELGGTDQLFNLLLGRELQKACGQEPQVVMTLPIIEGLDGVQKMSKSLNNYIGITEAPNDMFGKTMSISDELMWSYYKLILCLSPDEIETLRNSGRHPRDLKDELGQRIVARFHSVEAAEDASAEFARVFTQKKLPEDIPELKVSLDDSENGEFKVVWLIVKAGLAPSNGQARRLIEQGGVRIDDERIVDPHACVMVTNEMILRVGKRGFSRVSLVG